MARRTSRLRVAQPLIVRLQADARAIPLAENSVDLCLSSPPYWRKRRYGHADEIGQEGTLHEYASAMRSVLRELRRVVKPSGSVFLNLGDTYHRRSLVGVPHVIESAAREDGWRVRNRIIWAKPNGVPTPHLDRLTNRHEVILHLTGQGPYFYDLDALCRQLGTRSPGGDFWEMKAARHLGEHPAAFPDELASRVISLGCPERVCRQCGKPRSRIAKRSMDLDLTRPQARRALELFKAARLTRRHLNAIRATGISDAGKGRLQQGGRKNDRAVQRLANEAKKALRGYFREFTFARRVTVGFTSCRCRKGWEAGLVLDAFAGTGTTIRVAESMKRRAVGLDLLSWSTP